MNNEKLPKNNNIGQGKVKFCPIPDEPFQNGQKIQHHAKVAKFPQIWSHCSWPGRNMSHGYEMRSKKISQPTTNKLRNSKNKSFIRWPTC